MPSSTAALTIADDGDDGADHGCGRKGFFKSPSDLSSSTPGGS